MKPNRLPTLRELQPEALAQDVAQEFADDLRDRLHMIDASDIDCAIEQGPLYQAVLALARYARGDKLPPRTSVAQCIARLSPFYSSVYSRDVDPLTVEPPEPKTALGVAIQGARARAAFEAEEELSINDLALLVGMTREGIIMALGREHIPGAYKNEKLPRAPWRFKPTKGLREWMEARGAAI